MKFKLSLDLEVNVTVRTRDRDGRILEEIKSHNVTLDVGRTFLRDSLWCPTMPLGSYEAPYADPPLDAVGLKEFAGNNHRPMFVAVGTGGVFQTHSYPGQGTQTEVSTRHGLERPLPVAVNMDPPDGIGGSGGFRQSGNFWQWMKQIEPQDTSDPYQSRDGFSLTYRCIFTESEISFAGQAGDYGLAVPVSEFLLLTSAAFPYVAPTYVLGGEYKVLKANNSPFEWTPPGGVQQDYFNGFGGVKPGPDVIGALAYNISVPVTKTPNITMEVLWELRS